jgi:hypothetical protein
MLNRTAVLPPQLPTKFDFLTLQLSFYIEREAGVDIFSGEFWELHNDFGFGHARGQIFQHIINRDTGIPNAGLAGAPRGIDGYERLLCHSSNMSQFVVMVKPA